MEEEENWKNPHKFYLLTSFDKVQKMLAKMQYWIDYAAGAPMMKSENKVLLPLSLNPGIIFDSEFGYSLAYRYNSC